MKTVFLILLIVLAPFGKEKYEDCIEFNEKIPKFTQIELDAIEKYYPRIVLKKPMAVATHFLSSVKVKKNGYTFSFLDLESMRSHECKPYGLSTMVMDGGFDVFVNEKANTIEWNPDLLESKVQSNGK